MSDGRESPELALLFHVAASDGSPPAQSRTRELARAVVSWERFLERATQHAVISLASYELGRFATDLLTPDAAACLRDAARTAALRNLRLTSQLVEIERALSSAGVESIPFKGPTLAVLVYGNLTLRQFEDLDILVRKRDVDRARDSLFALGFSPVLALSADQRASLVLSGHHEQLVHAESGTTVELHWSLNNRALTHDDFEHHWWEELQPVRFSGATVQTLGPERLLLYLCMHGGKHSWARLSWLCDLQRALRTYPRADWETVWRLARENGSARMVEIGLGLVDEILDGRALTAPAWNGRRHDPKAEVLTRLLAQRLRGEPETVRPLDFRVQLRSRERYRDRLRYTWHVLATPHPADVSLMGLPRALHGLYYIARPLRLTWKYLGRRSRPASAP